MSFRFALLAALLVSVCLPCVTLAQSATKSAGSATKPAAEDGFVSMFNGKDFEGWEQHGGKAEYRIEGDAIVGVSKADTPNSFLCTTRDYSDFIMEVDLKVDNQLNSGIQIRSHVYAEPRTLSWTTAEGETKTNKIPADRVHGYQVEIDPSERSYSGGIYDEARRGWLNDLAGEEHKAARAAFKRGEWNHYRIEAIGNTIKTYINGVPAANLTDDVDASGLIALQVHSVSAENVGKAVRWKNILIKEVAAE